MRWCSAALRCGHAKRARAEGNSRSGNRIGLLYSAPHAHPLLRQAERGAPRADGDACRLGAPQTRPRRGDLHHHLRETLAIAQVVSDPDRKETFATAERIRNEFVLKVTGVVRRRPEGTVNPNIA